MAVLLALQLVGCGDGSTSTQSLSVRITASNPNAPTEPQLIQVMTELYTSVNYTDARSSPIGSRSPASGTDYVQPVTPDTVSIAFDGQELCQCASYSWSPATVADGTHHFTATATYRGVTGTGALEWKLQRGP